MKIKIQHRTTYRYNEPVQLGQHRLMMRPREGHDLHMESSILNIFPANHLHWIRDVNDNSIALIDFTENAAELDIYSEIVLNHYDANPLDFRMAPNGAQFPIIYDPESVPELSPYNQIIYPKDTAVLKTWLLQFWQPGQWQETIPLLQNVNQHIRQTFFYQRRDESGVQTPGETLQRNSGSCRDFATLFLEACRCWGLAARFISGYMLCPASEIGGASTHAWIEVYLPGAGWKGFDPTSGVMTDWKYVAVADSRHPEGAAPVFGSFFGNSGAFQSMFVDVTVQQIDKPILAAVPL